MGTDQSWCRDSASELAEIPCVETTASDTGSYQPEYERTDERASEDELHERLEALGYR